MTVQERDFQAPRFARDDWRQSNSAFYRCALTVLAAGIVLTAALRWLIPAII